MVGSLPPFAYRPPSSSPPNSASTRSSVASARAGWPRRARGGEEIIIAQAGVPIARLVPIVAATSESRLGLDAGAFTVPDDFDEPLLDDY